MQITKKFDPDFERELDHLRWKYGEDMTILNGFSEDQINGEYFNNAIQKKNLIDASIDGNANVYHRDAVTLQKEKEKFESKLQVFSDTFAMTKKLYGIKSAKKWFELEFNGGFYFHDATHKSPYCYAFDLTRLALEGLFFKPDQKEPRPAMHLNVFIQHVCEFVQFFCRRQSGAIGLPNLNIWTYYFWKHDIEIKYPYAHDPEYYRRQCFQEFIHRVNQPFARIDESAFTNTSVFDRNYLLSLFGGTIYPDGSMVAEQIDEIVENQKVFMEVMSNERSVNMMTFPVNTFSLLKRDNITETEKKNMLKTRQFNVFKDKEFARWASDHNVYWNDSNFFLSKDVGVLSNCCFDGAQEILIRKDGKIQCGPFWRLNMKYGATPTKDPDSIEVYHNGNWVKGHIVRLPKRPMYTISTVNGKVIRVTDNHLCPTQRGDVFASELTTDDYLMFSNRKLNGNKTGPYDYEDGVAVGLVLLGGTLYKPTARTEAIKIQIPYNECFELKEIMKHSAIRNGDEILISEDLNSSGYITYTTKSPSFISFLEKFISFSNIAPNNINIDYSILNESAEFRQGIIDAVSAFTSVNEKEKGIHNLGIDIIDSMEIILTSLGIQNEKKSETRVPLTYSLIFFPDPTNRDTENRIIRNNSDYWRISIIEKDSVDVNNNGYVYCVEINHEEPYFTLPNGMITHNCRLLSDTRKLDAFINSIGGTALSIGSVRVNTINLARIAYEAIDKSSEHDPYLTFIDILTERTRICCQVLHASREVLKGHIAAGEFPNYCEGGIELAKQYCTIGILGLYEAEELMGLIGTDELGNTYYTENAIKFASEIFETIDTVKDDMDVDFSYNIESVPGERAAVILCTKDNMLFEDHKDKFIYSNQWIPLTQKTTIHEKMRVSSILDNKCSGGSISHINLESNFPNKDAAWEILNMIALEDVIYSAFNTRINVCEYNHAFVGTNVCPKCGNPVVDTYQRVVGFLTPKSHYSIQRAKEFNARQWFDYANGMRE